MSNETRVVKCAVGRQLETRAVPVRAADDGRAVEIAVRPWISPRWDKRHVGEWQRVTSVVSVPLVVS